jgi:hypothetical protein
MLVRCFSCAFDRAIDLLEIGVAEHLSARS